MEKKEEKINIEELKNEMQELEKQKNEYLAGWQRERADFINYKKEEIERIETFLGHVKEEFIFKILPILDNFDMATRESSFISLKYSKLNKEEEKKIESIIQGFLQIKIQLQEFLKAHGVEEIKSTGEKFDPNFHEAIEQAESKDKESGVIIEEIQKGYKIKDRLLRPAKVRVTK